MGGPGVGYECLCKAGMHVNEDHYLAEIIDPETLRPLPYGEVGELVFTTLSREAQPLIRYRTRDLCMLIAEPCACGRTSVRMSKPIGRSDDMLIIRGVNVFPSQIEEVLMSIPAIEPHYQIVVDRKGYLDIIEVWVEVGEDIFAETMGDLERFQRERAGADLQRAQHPVRGEAQGAQDDPALRGQGRARRRPAQGAVDEGSGRRRAGLRGSRSRRRPACRTVRPAGPAVVVYPFSMPFPLVTPRLTIRPLTAGDGGDVFAVFAAPQVMRFWNSAPPGGSRGGGGVGGVPRGHAAPPRLRAVARERAERRPSGRHRRPAAARRRAGRRDHLRAGAVLLGRRLRHRGRRRRA